MSLQNVLQQLLQSAQGLTQPNSTPNTGAQRQESKSSLSLGSFAGGALSGGALALLMGNKKFRKMGGKVATYGGVAALGAVAYRAYDEWKAKQAQPQASSQPQAQPVEQYVANIQQLPAPQLENQSRLLLAAMISAAKADGHINQQEQQLLDAEFGKLQASETDRAWLAAQLQSPADPAAVAALVTTPEEKAEVYLASLLVTEADIFMEKAYLDELARQLSLEPGLKEHLEQTALSVQP